MKILSIKTVDTTAKNGAKKPMILVQTATKDIWVTPGQWKSTGANYTLDNYVGGDIDTEYFTEGEMLFDDVTECTKNDTILKTVYVSQNPAVLAHALAIESANKMADVMDRSAIFSRNRVVALTKAKEAAEALAKAKASTKVG